MLAALANVSGRKHPSTVQAKQLKGCLPMMPVVLHLVTSQVIVVKDQDMRNITACCCCCCFYSVGCCNCVFSTFLCTERQH